MCVEFSLKNFQLKVIYDVSTDQRLRETPKQTFHPLAYQWTIIGTANKQMREFQFSDSKSLNKKYFIQIFSRPHAAVFVKSCSQNILTNFLAKLAQTTISTHIHVDIQFSILFNKNFHDHFTSGKFSFYIFLDFNHESTNNSRNFVVKTYWKSSLSHCGMSKDLTLNFQTAISFFLVDTQTLSLKYLFLVVHSFN